MTTSSSPTRNRSRGVPGAQARILETTRAWPGVHDADGERGERSIRLGRRELGHLHGDRVLHIGFPKAVWHELHDAGRIGFHPVFPGRPGFAERRIEDEADVADVLALLRLNHDRAVAAHGVPDED